MTSRHAVVDVQYAVDFDEALLPDEASLMRWLQPAIDAHPDETRCELTVRYVDEAESRELNHTYRGKDASTNVLSFPFEAPPGLDIPLLGDLIISPHVVAREAEAQGKRLEEHFAHMTLHGYLHLLGYDHIDDDEAEVMEAMERRLLASLGIEDPYRDDA